MGSTISQLVEGQIHDQEVVGSNTLGNFIAQ